MITSRRMAAIDRNAAALGVPLRALMESSGNAVARRVRELTAPGDSVAIVCGRGNNGGDGLVAARFLEDRDVAVHLLGRPESITTGIARANWDALDAAGIDAETVTDSRDFALGEPGLIVDAMLGTGIAGALREPEASATRMINDAAAPVLAVDVPTGVDADDTDASPDGDAVEAEHVVTFHDLKPGIADHPDVTVADIGIPEAAEELVGPGDVAVRRDAGDRNADGGRTFVIGGGPYTGAPALAAGASLSAGADLAFVACPESVFDPIAGYSEDLIVQPYGNDDGESETDDPTDHLAPEHVPELVETAERHDDTVILGPGLGRHPETEEAARQFLAEFSGTAVVDADALALVPDVDTDADLVLTPNRSELAELGGPATDDLLANADAIRDLAADLGHTILAKGQVDVITDGERLRRCEAGTSGMTVGGTGDTLAGVVAALRSRTDPFEAACVGSYVNGRAAKLLDRGDGLRATELQGTIPEALEGGDDD